MITDVQLFYGIKFSVEKAEVIVMLKMWFFSAQNLFNKNMRYLNLLGRGRDI